MINLLVGTPAYGNQVHIDYLHSVLSYTSIPNLRPTIITLGNESLITRARNKLFALFVDYPNPKFDYLLFLDADIRFPAQELYKLLQHKKDIIGAPVRLKDLTREVLNIAGVEKIQSNLWKVERLGTAVMLISRKLALDVKQYAIKNDLVYPHNPEFSRGDNLPITQCYDVFRVGKIGETYLSEDYYFCQLVQRLGYTVYVDPTCTTVHHGSLPLVYTLKN